MAPCPIDWNGLRLVSREGLRHSLGRLRCWKYHALAAITPAAFVMIVLLVDVLTGGDASC